jgi:hypothetical protein
MIATRLFESVRSRGKSFARVAPTLAPSDRIPYQVLSATHVTCDDPGHVRFDLLVSDRD